MVIKKLLPRQLVYEDMAVEYKLLRLQVTRVAEMILSTTAATSPSGPDNFDAQSPSEYDRISVSVVCVGQYPVDGLKVGI